MNYFNGITEGINSKIKLIKRVSFDYSSFYHLREHIYIIQGFIYN
ncbi:transposase [Vagococcus acidifermentans]